MSSFTEYTINFNGDIGPISKIVEGVDGYNFPYASSEDVAKTEIKRIVEAGGIYDYDVFYPIHRIDNIVLTDLTADDVEKRREKWVRKNIRNIL